MTNIVTDGCDVKSEEIKVVEATYQDIAIDAFIRPPGTIVT